MAIDFRPHQRLLPGKNGKQYRIPSYAPHSAPDFARFLSCVEYGKPNLNADEQAIYNEIYPLLARESERLSDAAYEQIEGLCGDADDFGYSLTFAQKQIEELNAEDLAYTIAEDLVEAGFRLVRADENSG